MASDTKTLSVGSCKELLADVRNAGEPYFEKGVFIYSHRYVAGTDYTIPNNLIINVPGAKQILSADIKEVLAATNAALAFAESDYATGVGKTLTTAATNGSSLAVQVNIIAKV